MTGEAESPRIVSRDNWVKRSGTSRKTHALYPILVGIFIAIGGIFTILEVREHIIESLRDELVTIQDSQESAIRFWLRQEVSDVMAWAYNPDLRTAAIELTDSDGSGTPADAVARQRVIRELDGLLATENVIGYALFNRASEVIASSDPIMVSENLTPSGLAIARAVIGGASRITFPFITGRIFQGTGAASHVSVMIKATPVRSQSDEVIAAMVVAVRADEFVGILGLGRFGRTGVTYPVSRRGLMMAENRVRDHLDALGLIADAGKDAHILVYPVRDPGGDLTKGYTPTVPSNRQPLTFAAAAVSAGDTGYELEGYRNYTGVRVMGAWRWLDDLEFGLVTEIEYREALAPLRPLIVAVSGLLFMLVLAVVGLIIYAQVVRRLNRDIENVRQLGQYKLIELIGEGAMGQVYRARHRLLVRDTAVKMLKPDVVNEEAVARFEQEVQQTSQLTHPNTVEIYDYGRTDEGIFYYAMEYLDGYDLATLLEMSGPLPAARTVHVLRQACLSLREAHQAGLIHRDIKPKNIILCARGGEYDVVKVVDFGLVKEVGVKDRGVTQVNIIPGTPPYIAPERMKGDNGIDARVDIYALGAVGFGLLTGEPVFDGDTSVEIAYKAMHEEPGRPSERVSASIPELLDTLVQGMLAANPDERPPDVDSLLRQLEEIALESPWDRTQAAAWWKEHPARA